MAISPQMQLKLDNINILIEKGYSVKTRHKNWFPILISPEGKVVNLFFKSKYFDDYLPGFSWIAFFFPFVFATKIRDWKFFWFLGLTVFILSIVEFIFDIDSSTGSSIGISMFYGSFYPLQRWLFEKSNKQEIGTFFSLLLGLFLAIIACIPAVIIDSIKLKSF